MQSIPETIKEVSFAILPVALVVFVLQFTIIGLPAEDFMQFVIGVLLVGSGLIFFLLGVHIGLLPIGELIGASLPRFGKVWLIVGLSFVLGFVVTVAEPDVRILANYVDNVSDGEINRHLLIYTVALGLALFVGLAILRIIYNIPIKYLLMGGYGAIFLLAWFVPEKFISISFDAGGVTTGPLAVPFILAYGVGVAAVLGGRKSSDDGFGLVALASIGPVLAVLILGILYG
ncbi:DUF1538 domain-containing protein [Balneolaceae bacterium ANBcel3]|nr:DUF1538 domain-containing protein [Balneolaceae bacterium ANBcel3]